ncbi:MAG: hypothetical protein RLP44_09460 [Aggregatilineales bacterium]
MANTDRTRKLLVRTALATSTTIATLVGAQNFAMLDTRDFQLTDNELLETVGINTTSDSTNMTIAHSAPQITIMHVAPSITVLRQSGQTTATTTQAVAMNPVNIQPPVPSQITVPQPVVVQQPRAQRSRSTR